MHLQLREIPCGPHAPLLQTCRGEQGLDGEEEDGGRSTATACTTKPKGLLAAAAKGAPWGEQAESHCSSSITGCRVGSGRRCTGTSWMSPPCCHCWGHTSLLHITPVFRSAEKLNTFCFLLMGHVSVKEMLSEIFSLVEKSIPGGRQPDSLGTHSPVPGSLGRGRALGCARAAGSCRPGAGRGWAAQQPES